MRKLNLRSARPPGGTDFVIERNGASVVCEAKGFETPPALQKRLDGTNLPIMVGDDEVYGPMRSAVVSAQAPIAIAANWPGSTTQLKGLIPCLVAWAARSRSDAREAGPVRVRGH